MSTRIFPLQSTTKKYSIIATCHVRFITWHNMHISQSLFNIHMNVLYYVLNCYLNVSILNLE